MFTYLILNLLISFSPQSVYKPVAVSVVSEKTPCTLYVFTGSDWCSNCQRLEKNILKDSVFLQVMQQSGIGIKILDFPQRKKLPEEVVAENDMLSGKLGFTGIFPTMVILNMASGNKMTFLYNNEKPSELAAAITSALPAIK